MTKNIIVVALFTDKPPNGLLLTELPIGTAGATRTRRQQTGDMAGHERP